MRRSSVCAASVRVLMTDALSSPTADAVTRRRLLGAGATVLASATLSGCLGGDGDGGGQDGAPAGDGMAGGGDGTAGGDQAPQAIDEFLADANEYTGSVEDATGQSEVSIDVGAGDGFAFAPPAVRVSTGTLVRWQWTGRGNLHNVVSVPESDAAFDSGDPVQGSEPTYEQPFDQPGTMLYVCEPHRAVGMLGAIEVVQ